MKHGIKTPYDRNTPDWPIIHVRRQSISSDQLFPAWINVKEKVQFNLLPWDPRIGCNGQITECGSWGYRPIQVGSHMNVKTCRMFHNLYMVCPTSISNTYKVFCSPHMVWMCTCSCPTTLAMLLSAKPLEVILNSSGYLPRSKPQGCVVIEVIDPFMWAPISLSNTYKVYHNLHMVWICIWSCP